MSSLKKYKEFMDGYSQKATEMKLKILDRLYDEILPGIRDILYTYQDNQEATLVANVVDYYYKPIYKKSDFDHQLNHISIRVMPIDLSKSIKNSKEVLGRILSEYGDDISINSRTKMNIESGQFEATSFEFHLF